MFKKTLPAGATLIPVILASDETHLTNFSGDKKAWPLYLTIGNIPSDVRMKPLSQSVLLLANLPIHPKKASLSRSQKEKIESIFQDALYDVLQPLVAIHKTGIELEAGDGQVRQCFLRISGWTADYMEYLKLFGLSMPACPRCLVKPAELQEYVPRTLEHNYELYHTIKCGLAENGNHELKDILLDERVTKPILALSRLPDTNISMLHKPDELHGLRLGLCKDIMEWSTLFLKEHGRHQVFDTTWKSLARYPNFQPPTIAWSQTTQYSGKEMRNMTKVLVGVLGAALSYPTAVQRPLFLKAVTCVRSLMNFIHMSSYRSHNEQTITLMESYWKEFCTTRSIYLPYRPRKAALKKRDNYRDKAMRELSMENAKRRMTYSERYLKQRKEQINKKAEQIFSTHHSFNYPKMHLPNHYADHIRQYGSINAFSTEFSEAAHVKQMKDGWRHSNHINAMDQILKFYHRKHLFYMRELNILSIAWPSTSIDAIANVFIDLYSRKERLELHKNNRNGLTNELALMNSLTADGQDNDEDNDDENTDRALSEHGDNNDVTSLSTYLLKGRVRNLSFNSTVGEVSEFLEIGGLSEAVQRFILKFWENSNIYAAKDSARRLKHLDSLSFFRQLSIKVYNQLLVPVEDFQNTSNTVIHPIRCSQNDSKKPRRDCVFVDKRAPLTILENFQGRRVAVTRLLFQVFDPIIQANHDLAACYLPKILNNGEFDSATDFLKVGKHLLNDASRLQLYQCKNILGIAHLIPIPQDFRARASGGYEEYQENFVNTHVDLTIFNMIYN